MNCGFRTFVGWGYDPALNVYLEAMGDRSREVRMPIPSMVTNVLRNVPSGSHRANYAAALKWIFSKGLYVAAQKRHELAQQASQMVCPDGQTIGQKVQQLSKKMGQPREEPVVYDHEMYSKQAQEFFAQNGIPELKEFYDKTYGAHPEEYEPDAIRFDSATLLGTNLRNKGDKDVAARTSHGIKIPLKDLNDYLTSQGKAPFQFGGPNGLIEYMEDGPWAPVRSPMSPTEFEHGARNGFDLSDPKRYVDKSKEGGHIFYRFSDFSPPKDDRVYNTAVNQIIKHSANLVGGQDTPDHLPDDEKAELERLRGAGLKPHSYTGTATKTAHIWDDPAGNNDYPAYHNRTNRVHDYSDKQDEYALLKFLIMMGIEEEKENPGQIKGGIKDFNTVHDDLFPNGSNSIRSRYKTFPEQPASSRNTTDTLVNLGAQRVRRLTNNGANMGAIHDALLDMAIQGKLGADPDMETLEKNLVDVINHVETNKLDAPAEPGDYPYAKMIPYSQNTTQATPEQLQALLDKGYKLVRTREERQAGIRPDQIPDRDEFEIALGDSVYWISKDRQSGLFNVSTTEEDDNQASELPKGFKSPRPAMLGGAQVRFNTQQPEATPMTRKGQGEDLLRQMEADPQRFGYGYGEEGAIGINSPIKDIYQAAEAAGRMAKWRAKSMGIPDSVLRGLDDESLKAFAMQVLQRHARDYRFYYGSLDNPRLKNYFSATGVSDPALQDQAIELMKEMQKQRMSPDKIDQQMPEEFKPAFAINGKWWRQPKMKDHVISVMRGEMGNERASGGAGADAEGNEIEDQRFDNAAGRRQDLMNNDFVGKGGGRFRVDPMTGKVISDDIEEAPDDVKGSDVMKDAGQLKNTQKPFTKLAEPMLNGEANPGQARIDYNRGHGYAFDRNMPQQMKDRELSMHLMQSLRRLDQAESEPFQTGLLDGVGDAVHARVYRYLANPNQEEYPFHTVQMFLKPGGKYYLGTLIPHGSSQISQMQRDIEAAAPAQAPEEEPEQQAAHGGTGDQSGPLHPTFTVLNPRDGQPITIDTPDDLRHWYDQANQTRNGPLANELRRQAIATGNKEYMAIVTPQQTGLGQVNSAPVPQPQAPQPKKFSMDFVPGLSATPAAPAPAPQAPAPQGPRPGGGGGGLAGRVRKPGAPWPGPHQNEAMETFAEFRLRQAREALVV